MLKSFTFGCGQGATKAMLCAINTGVLDEDYCMIVNSTSKDIPENYVDNAMIISDDKDAGCGKIREAAKTMMSNYLKSNPNIITNLIFNEDNPIDFVNIIATSEGASGSGASVVLAKYIKYLADINDLDITVNIILITGFESDTRGLQNTINYFKDLNGADYTIRIVSNKKYLETCATTFEAEDMANNEVASVLSILGGIDIISSDHNIDNTDHMRLISNPGLVFTGEVNMKNKKYKNTDQLNKELSDMVDYTSSLDFDPSATMLGIYMNVSEDNMSAVDTSFSVIKKKLCGTDSVPELFVHKQYNGKDQFIRVIASGLDLPQAELEIMYNKYENNICNTKSNADCFFDSLSSMDSDILSKKKSVKKVVAGDFFDEFDQNSEEVNKVMKRTTKTSKLSNNTITTGEKPAKSSNLFKTNSKKDKVVDYSEDSIEKY